MRITIAAIGSTGDVLPYLGLGRQLTAHGHEVTVATHRSFQPAVEEAGLRYAFVPMEPQHAVTDELAERLRGGPRTAAAAIGEVFRPWAWDMAAAVDAACDTTDHLLVSALAWTGVHSADARGLPSSGVYLQPLEPTRAFAPAAMGPRSFGAILNRELGRRVQAMMVEPYMDVVNGIRQRHGLAGISAQDHLRGLRERDWPVLHGFSPAVVPRPGDWRSGLQVVGYWWPPARPGWQPDPTLTGFLNDGDPPVFVGFGSTFPAPAGELAAMLRSIRRQLGVRMVVQAGWLDLRDDGDDVYTVEAVPHDWLFPRVAAAVHHSGAGTAAAALRAGIPSVPVPVSLDQPFWAARMHGLGVATRPVPASGLTEARLARGISDAIRTGPIRTRAAELGASVAAENGGAPVAEALTGLPR